MWLKDKEFIVPLKVDWAKAENLHYEASNLICGLLTIFSIAITHMTLWIIFSDENPKEDHKENI